MAMNAYEIRYNVLTDARQMLMDQWMRACDHQVGFMRAHMEITEDTRPHKLPPAPTMAEIKALATEMYDFVKTKD